MYDVVMSLGYNCEVSFRLENFFGKIEAMPFSWSYVTDRNKFPDAIEHIEDLFSGEKVLQEDHMIKCDIFGLKFHPRYEILPKYGEVSQKQIDEAVEELKNRVEHLKKKCIELFNSDKRSLFIMKVQSNNTEDDIKYIKNVHEALEKRYISGKYTLAVVTDKQELYEKAKLLKINKIKVFRLKKFAHIKHTDISGDVRAWYKILQELTGQESKEYFKRLNKKRKEWFFAVLKKKLRME